MKLSERLVISKYRRLSKIHHSDKAGGSTEAFQYMLKAYRDAMVNFIAKLQNKSPSNHEMAMNINCLDPKFIYNNPCKAVDKFRKALDCATEAKLLSDRDYDMAYEQFQRFKCFQKRIQCVGGACKHVDHVECVDLVDHIPLFDHVDC